MFGAGLSVFLRVLAIVSGIMIILFLSIRISIVRTVIYTRGKKR